MDENEGYQYSWTGFVDYTKCYHYVSPFLIAVGVCITVGTGLSLIPQLVRIIKRRSSYGISPIFAFLTSFGQVLIVLNFFSLHNADFYALPQISYTITFPRLLTFSSCFTLWFVYLPVAFLTYVYHDIPHNIQNEKQRWKISTIMCLVLLLISIICYIPIPIIGATLGFASKACLTYGKVLGTISTAITILQYMPQFITTCKIKDNGSISIVTLAIQAPGGTINAFYMMLAHKENWTTWLSLLCSAIQQWILLALCIFYKLRNRKRLSMENAQSEASSSIKNKLINEQRYTTV